MPRRCLQAEVGRAATQCAMRSRKRRQAPTPESLPIDVDRHPRKKPKHIHPSQPPPPFWDHLSEIPLVRGALCELNRRNAVAHPETPAVNCPNTRRASRSFQSASSYLQTSTPARLRRIKRFARGRRPGFFRNMSQSSLGRRKRGSQSPTKRSSNTTSTKSTGPYDRAFQQHLIDHGIYPYRYEYPDGGTPPPPDNLEEIRAVLALPRPSLSPSRFTNDDSKKFEKEDAHATKEWQIVTNVVPIIEGDIADRKCVSGQIPFNNLDHLTDGSLVSGNPDRYYGARPEQLDRKVRANLDGLVIPSTQHDHPIMPNNLLAVKGPDGSAAVAIRQANYDGALGARGMQSILSHGSSEPQYDGNSRVITSTYHSGTLKMFTSHVKQPTQPGGRPEYVMTHLDSWALTGNIGSCRQGLTAYRNGLDWAKHQRNEAIKLANSQLRTSSVSTQVAGPPTTDRNLVENNKTTSENTKQFSPSEALSTSQGYESSADELAIDAPVTKRKPTRGRHVARPAA
ncbi:hypothetical protein PG994_006928 [Apiospora phragmitis]|uniref:Uncharacterized protein n=1 Tax=Apiospora phragmitis TaxID=2905665 RepID=A0ABR1VHG8_9PEZI